MTHPTHIEFSYRPGRIKAVILFSMVLCGQCLMVYLALFGDMTPMNVSGIHLSAAQVRFIIRLVAVLGPIGVAGLAMFVKISFSKGARVALDNDHVTLPKINRFGMPAGQITIPVDQLVSVEVRPFVGWSSMLLVDHKTGRVVLYSNMFLGRHDFKKFADALSAILRTRTGA
jgi:hypothetical protein